MSEQKKPSFKKIAAAGAMKQLMSDYFYELDAAANLLLQYDAYLQKRTSIRAMIDGAKDDSSPPPASPQTQPE